MRDGSLYNGHKMFLGNGKQRSCGKCGAFSATEGFRKRNPYGMVGLCCLPKENK
jgi:hypothetical protein